MQLILILVFNNLEQVSGNSNFLILQTPRLQYRKLIISQMNYCEKLPCWIMITASPNKLNSWICGIWARSSNITVTLDWIRIGWRRRVELFIPITSWQSFSHGSIYWAELSIIWVNFRNTMRGISIDVIGNPIATVNSVMLEAITVVGNGVEVECVLCRSWTIHVLFWVCIGLLNLVLSTCDLWVRGA